jgi:hypothetical protein
LIPTASLTLLSLLVSTALTLSGVGSPVAVAHLAFAVGIVPLIFAAISHFVPVLTRTGDPESVFAGYPASKSADDSSLPPCRVGCHAGFCTRLLRST